MILGVHAVLFKGRIANETEQIVSMIKSTGAEAFEMGARFFDIAKRTEFKAILDKENITLSGLHVANNLVDFLDKKNECRAKLIAAAEFLDVFPYKNIIMTGSISQDSFDAVNLGDDRLLDSEHVVKIASTLEEFYQEIKQNYGVVINYHNHNWEFKNNALIFNTLWEHAPSLKFALDIGWSGISGYDCVDLIKKDPTRFKYLHLRNYHTKVMSKLHTFEKLQNAYNPISEGDVDFKELFALLNTYMDDNQICLVEYETGDEDIQRYTSAIQFLKSVRYSR